MTNTPLRRYPVPVLILAAACSRTSATVGPRPIVVEAVEAAAPIREGGADAASFTRVTVRVTERRSTTTATSVEMRSKVSVITETERGVSTIGPIEWPCWAGLSAGRLQCAFGASYEQARVEKENGTCAVVADFYGENTGEKKNVRKFGSFPCHDPIETRFEEAPGLANAP